MWKGLFDSGGCFVRRIRPGTFLSLLRKRLLLIFYGSLFALLPEFLPAAGLSLRVSPVYRRALTMKIRGQSMSSDVIFSEIQEGPDSEELQDDLDYGDRFFADGYVCRDEGTGKPGGLLPDSTWNWGYQSESQYDAEENTLTFRRQVPVVEQEVRRIERNNAPERCSDRGRESCGVEFAAEFPVAELRSGECMISAGWQWIPGWQQQTKFTSFNQNYLIRKSLIQAEDRYSFVVYGSDIPPAGYSGCSEGPFADPPAAGTLISNRPAVAERIFPGEGELLSSGLFLFRNQVRFQLDCEQQEFWFGPVLRRRWFCWMDCSISPRFNLLYAAMELRRDERLWQHSPDKARELRESWRHRRDAKRLLAGASLSCTLENNWTNGFFAGLNFSASWYPEKLELRAGPGKVSMQAGAFCAGAVFGYRF